MSSTHEEWRRLPSLRALLAFAAAGEEGNFSRAAQALYVTQGAVSRHVCTLEGDLGVQLFARHGNRVAITPDGLQYMQQVQGALDALHRATEQLRRKAGSRQLTVSTLPSFAAKWLSPRLSRFYSLVPDAELHIDASRRLVNFGDGGIDVAIRYGPGRWPGVTAVRLMREEVFPVCSPSLVQNARSTDVLQVLGRATLLHSDNPESWPQWFEHAGVHRARSDMGPSFNDDLALIQAAIDGHGFALGRSALVERELAAGTLVAPFPQRMRAKYSYWVVKPKGRASNQLAAAFEHWLFNERNTNHQPVQSLKIES